VIEGAFRDEWAARFVALIQSENERKPAQDRLADPPVTDANILDALASALRLDSAFLARHLAASPPAGANEAQRREWQAARDGLMEASGELRAFAFLKSFNSITTAAA